MPAPDEDAGYVQQLVRALDRPRYYATLFAPEQLRTDLFALYAFAAEIGRIPDMVSNPALGEIRLQFWADRLDEIGAPTVEGAPPILRLLSSAILRHSLPVAPLAALVEACRADLYSDPPATITDAEGLFGETDSSLFQLAALIHGSAGSESADAAGHAGVAYGLARRLAGLAHDRAARRAVLPGEILAAQGLGPADVFAAEPGPALVNAVRATIELARSHLRDAQAPIAGLPKQLRLAFLPLAVAEPLLKRIDRLGPSILHEPAQLADLETLARIGLRRLALASRPG